MASAAFISSGEMGVDHAGVNGRLLRERIVTSVATKAVCLRDTGLCAQLLVAAATGDPPICVLIVKAFRQTAASCRPTGTDQKDSDNHAKDNRRKAKSACR